VGVFAKSCKNLAQDSRSALAKLFLRTETSVFRESALEQCGGRDSREGPEVTRKVCLIEVAARLSDISERRCVLARQLSNGAIESENPCEDLWRKPYMVFELNGKVPLAPPNLPDEIRDPRTTSASHQLLPRPGNGTWELPCRINPRSDFLVKDGEPRFP
jgi:hypothetical protein